MILLNLVLHNHQKCTLLLFVSASVASFHSEERKEKKDPEEDTKINMDGYISLRGCQRPVTPWVSLLTRCSALELSDDKDEPETVLLSVARASCELSSSDKICSMRSSSATISDIDGLASVSSEQHRIAKEPNFSTHSEG